MSNYLALIEVDQRQNFILRADKLREMLGASRLIERTKSQTSNPPVEIIWPVSGVLWLTSPDLSALSIELQRIRSEFHNDGLSATFVVGEYSEGTFTENLLALERRMRVCKDSKSGEDCAPRSPFFAQCSIQGRLPANNWRPDDRHPRRRLVSEDSERRLGQAPGYARKLWSLFDRDREYTRPIDDLDDLDRSDSDSYIALIKADGDGVGRLLPKIDWRCLRDSWNPGSHITTVTTEFARSLNDAVNTALDNAIRTVIRRDTNKQTCFPILPLVAAGDDLWILCRRDLAFPLIEELGREFAEATQQPGILRNAVNLFQNGQPLSMSFGLLFAKKGFPFDAQLHLAEELERTAKTFRRTLAIPEGCVDYQWLESSGRASIEEMRKAGYSIKDVPVEFLLTTRPWTLTQMSGVLAAALQFARLPRGKRHQLNAVLRYGEKLSDLAYARWRQELAGEERKVLTAAVQALPAELRPVGDGPWFPEGEKVRKSALLDLVELAEIIAL